VNRAAADLLKVARSPSPSPPVAKLRVKDATTDDGSGFSDFPDFESIPATPKDDFDSLVQSRSVSRSSPVDKLTDELGQFDAFFSSPVKGPASPPNSTNTGEIDLFALGENSRAATPTGLEGFDPLMIPSSTPVTRATSAPAVSSNAPSRPKRTAQSIMDMFHQPPPQTPPHAGYGYPGGYGYGQHAPPQQQPPYGFQGQGYGHGPPVPHANSAYPAMPYGNAQNSGYGMGRVSSAPNLARPPQGYPQVQQAPTTRPEQRQMTGKRQLSRQLSRSALPTDPFDSLFA